MSSLTHPRRAELKDLNSIVKLLADDRLGQKRERYAEPLPEVYVKALKNILADPNQELMVLESESGGIIGTLQLSFIQYLTYQGGIRAQIEAVRVHKSYRGKGIGQKLFEWAIARAKERGAHLVQLTTDKKRPEELKFYEKLGFTASHEGMKLHFT
ncbi:MAG: GNAT family N-acetyltransferase [Bacteroidota bacterium]